MFSQRLRQCARRPSPWVGLPIACVLLFGAPAQAAEMADPTRPAGRAPVKQQVVAPADLNLSAILVREDTRRARINGQWVAVGSMVGGVKVIGIQPEYVRILRDGRSETLRLVASGSMKKQVGQ